MLGGMQLTAGVRFMKKIYFYLYFYLYGRQYLSDNKNILKG